MSVSERHTSVPRMIRQASSDGDVLPFRPARRTVRLTRTRTGGRKKYHLRLLTLGLLASLSTLHLILFRRAKRRLGF